ncbi:hypothetical protein GCM10010191_19900 [Actinomadura vinacea]|uniref:Uncharacterized protein n=1 Tax=Actinomadura vinacea TaxID=115336 RepID=A0ABP5VWN1_9ACTN
METPPNTMAVARATCLDGTSRTASPPAMAQNPPTATPIATRAASSTAKWVAAAHTRLATAMSPMSEVSSTRRSTPPARTVITGAEAAATKPGTVSMSPAVPSETSRSEPMGVSRPTGSSSEVIRAKMPSVTAKTGAHCRAGDLFSTT